MSFFSASPGPAILTDAVAWLEARVAEERVILIHCAKGRGRSATVLAAYLMRTEGRSFPEVQALLASKRPLVKLQARHRRALEAWLADQPDAGPRADAKAGIGDAR